MYADTKIRLHFAYFKVVESSRDTCFLDPPHQCTDINKSASNPSVPTAGTVDSSVDTESYIVRDEL